MAQKGISLKPSEAVTGGGLLDDFDGKVTAAEFVEWDYNGRIDIPVPALHLTIEVEDENDVEQYFSAGSIKEVQPSDNGRQLIPQKDQQALRDNTNTFLFLKSVVDAGFPEDDLEDNVKVLEGLEAHFRRVPQPKRAGLTGAQDEEGRAKTVLTISKIISMPGGKKGKGKSKSKSSSTSDTDVDTAAQLVVLKTLIDNDGDAMPVKKIAPKAFKLVKDSKLRTKVVKKVQDEDFLTEMGLDVEDGEVSGDMDMLTALLEALEE